MRFLKSLFQKTYKVPRSISRIVRTEFNFTKIKESEPAIITITSSMNCSMDIVVVKRTYMMERNKGLFFTRYKKFYIYQVTGIVPECFPTRMRKVMNSTLQIPTLLPSIYPEEYRINAVVSAFLDIKMSIILKNGQE